MCAFLSNNINFPAYKMIYYARQQWHDHDIVTVMSNCLPYMNIANFCPGSSPYAFTNLHKRSHRISLFWVCPFPINMSQIDCCVIVMHVDQMMTNKKLGACVHKMYA